MDKRTKTTHVRGCPARQNWIVILALACAAIQHAFRLSTAGPIADRDAVWRRLDKDIKSPAQLELAFLEYWLKPDDSPTNLVTNVGPPSTSVSSALHRPGKLH